jgi:asparagine synthase (glutamine-hydrolysing)
MCGIVGKVCVEGPVDRELIERMCAVVEHRGPDSRGVLLDPGIGLGIQRLAVIDLETGDQPMLNEDESVAVVLNGEIYNYRELRGDLERNGHRFASRSDTEVIVHLYEDYGDRCVEWLRGMFGFALWDRRRRRLLLARDRLGKKPLFYAHRGGCLWFASEAKSILQDPAIPRDVDVRAVDAFLHSLYVPAPRSAFAALRKLPPAHTLTWEDGDVGVRRYWKLSYASRQPPVDEAELHEALRDKLLDATALRMRSDVPLGALLSGGIDSSAVVAAMVRTSAAPIKTFAMGFDHEEFDETSHARVVAAHLGTEHTEVRVEPEALEVLPRLVWHYDEPFADSSAVPTFYLAELTRRYVTVALNGDGGDENFAGYTRYWGNEVAARLARMPRPLAQLCAAAVARLDPGAREDTQRARLQRLLGGLGMAPYDRYAAWIACFGEAERRALYQPEFLAALGEPPACAAIREAYEGSDGPTLLDRLLDVDVATYLPGDLLVKMDVATMAHSLEVRSPLLDHEFMEFVAGLPASLKLDGRVTKRVFKDALRPWLPDSILGRGKMGFQVPLREWLRGPLRELPADVLLDRRTLERGWFREERLREIIADHAEGRRDNSRRIWGLIQLELWLRTFVDAGVTEPVALAVG